MDIKFFKFIKERKVNVAHNAACFVKIIAKSSDYIPSFQTKGAAGADLRSYEDYILEPNQVTMVDAGFRCQIADGYHAKITARSSMGRKGIIVPNSPGIIDSDYTGDIRVLLLNLSSQPFEIHKGDRIAQWILEKNVDYAWQEVNELTETERDPAGFGTTGKR
jgi:dUTP pyrophosphatase